MKVFNLNFLSEKDIERLGEYAQMTLKDFTEKVDSKIARGKHVKKECMPVYDYLCKHLEDYPEILEDDNIDSETIEEVIEVVEPIEVLPSKSEPDTHLVADYRLGFFEKDTLSSFPSFLKWAELANVMKSELIFCEKWMQYEGLDLNAAIETFVDFLKNAANYNLNTIIPQALYKYWFDATNPIDRVMCMNSLALGFEGLLSEIDYRNNGTRRLNMNGLCAWIQSVCPALKKALTDTAPKGFYKAMVQLRNYRNSFAHGISIASSSFETVRSILQFVALYTYTVAKYA